MTILEAIDKAKKDVNPSNKISEADRMNLEFNALLTSIKWNQAYPIEAESLIKQMEFNANFSQTYLNKMRIDGMEEQNKATKAMKDATVSMKRATRAIAIFALAQVVIAVLALCYSH